MEHGPEVTDILPVIRSRRSVRQFSDRAVPESAVQKMVEAARWAPSASNRQPWVLIVVDAPGLIEELRACSPGLMGRPSAVVCVAIDTSRTPAGQPGSESIDSMDAAMAAQNLMLEATSLGVGSCPVASFDGAAVSRLLHLPAHVVPKLLVTLGYPRVPAKAPRRRPYEEVVYRNAYGWVGSQETGTRKDGDDVVSGGETPRASAMPETVEPLDQSGPQALAEAAPTPDLAREILKVVAFCVCSAKLLLGEPRSYGPLRLVDAAARLAEASIRCGYGDKATGALLQALHLAKEHLVGGQTEEFLRLADAAVAASMFTDEKHQV